MTDKEEVEKEQTLLKPIQMVMASQIKKK
ncbi:hypothetical protein [Streptococcus pseudopneumoniae]